MEDLNPLEDIIDKDEEKKIFTELNKIEGLHEYLRCLMSRDLKLHFSCKKEQQDIVRGAYHRTEYLINLMKKYSSVDK